MFVLPLEPLRPLTNERPTGSGIIIIITSMVKQNPDSVIDTVEKVAGIRGLKKYIRGVSGGGGGGTNYINCRKN